MTPQTVTSPVSPANASLVFSDRDNGAKHLASRAGQRQPAFFFQQDKPTLGECWLDYRLSLSIMGVFCLTASNSGGMRRRLAGKMRSYSKGSTERNKIKVRRQFCGVSMYVPNKEFPTHRNEWQSIHWYFCYYYLFHVWCHWILIRAVFLAKHQK